MVILLFEGSKFSKFSLLLNLPVESSASTGVWGGNLDCQNLVGLHLLKLVLSSSWHSRLPESAIYGNFLYKVPRTGPVRGTRIAGKCNYCLGFAGARPSGQFVGPGAYIIWTSVRTDHVKVMEARFGDLAVCLPEHRGKAPKTGNLNYQLVI